ncbi:uncharacterized protein IWZ02DRAFT_432107 [Phyllosticta citriasiana]|uniref:uncharacterized protein n=1 Tax=Phyllosticta citriasiana TaxID=595635 RepID=UPI0030FD3E65
MRTKWFLTLSHPDNETTLRLTHLRPPLPRRNEQLPSARLRRESSMRQHPAPRPHPGGIGGGDVRGIERGRTVQVVSRIWDAALFARGVKSPKAPDQIVLPDGLNAEIQRVGAADEQNGGFVSKKFRYVGGVKARVKLASYQQDVDVYSAIVVR